MTDIVRKALQPEDRLGIGDLVYHGYRADHVAELVHLLTIDLHSALDEEDTARVRRIKAELMRCYRLCARAVASKTKGARPTAAAADKGEGLVRGPASKGKRG